MIQLTESWAGVYLQVAATILVFALGILLIVEQINISEDLRRVIHRHLKPTVWLFVVFFLTTLITLCYIWLLHPIELSVAGCWRDRPGLSLTPNSNLLASILITLVVTTPIVLLGLIQVVYSRDCILNHLERECRRHIKRKGFSNERALEDIRLLFEQSKTRIERVKVLETFEKLAADIQVHEQYRGKELEDVIKSIELALRKCADIDSFAEGILTLKRIASNCPESELISSVDVGFVLRVLQRLGNTACAMDYDYPAHKILEAIESTSQGPQAAFLDATLAFLKIGAAALEHKRFLVAIEALSKLEAITWPKQPLDAQASAAYLGLIAHFKAETGVSAQRKASESVNGVVFSPSLQTCLEGAREIHFNAARFDTADKLADMIAKLE